MYKYQDKKANIQMMNETMLNKSLGMFEYEGLPETLPAIEIEKRLQTKGFVFIYEHESNLYAFTGGFSGELNHYNEPTEITLSVPYLKLQKTVKIDDGVLIKNDDNKTGLIPIYDKYNSILNENEITMMMNNYSNRMQQFMSASDDKTKASADKFVENIIKGDLGVVAESQIFDGLKNHTQTTQGVSSLDLIEFQQYMKASLFNEIGIDLNFNMKRERLTSGEVEQNGDILYPLTNAMHRNRLEGVNRLNEKFGLNVGLHYGSIWKDREILEEEETEETKIEPEETEIIEVVETEETEIVPRETLFINRDDETFLTVEEIEEEIKKHGGNE